MLVWYFLIVWPTLCAGKHIPSFAGPYNVVIRNGVTNETDEFVSTGDMWARVRTTHYRVGHPQYYWGRIFTRLPFSDDLKLNIHMSSWSNNKWNRNAFVMKFNRGCHDAKLHAQALADLLFGEDAKKCPFPPGDRVVKNHTRELTFPQFPIFPYGRWLFNMVGYINSKLVGVFIVEVETVPKLN